MRTPEQLDAAVTTLGEQLDVVVAALKVQTILPAASGNPDSMNTTDPSIGGTCFEPVAVLANARRAGIDCLGNLHFGIKQFEVQKAKTAEAIAYAATFDVPADLAEYQWLVNGFALPETDTFRVSGPDRFKDQTLASFLAQAKIVSGGTGGPGVVR